MINSKFDNMKIIMKSKMILIIRTDDETEAKKIAVAAVDGGIKALEITMAVPNALKVIDYLSKKYKYNDIVVGAGTVLDSETANAAMLAGARLLVSPNLNPQMIAIANRYQAITISGAMTPTEIANTVNAGADFVKLFPAEFLGPKYVKTVNAPLPQAEIVPTGGVNPDNVKDWLAAGCHAVGVGSFVTKAHKKDGDFSKITEAARIFVNAIKVAENK